MRRIITPFIFIFLVGVNITTTAKEVHISKVDERHFNALLFSREGKLRREALSEIKRQWSPAFIPQLLEIIHLGGNVGDADKIVNLLNKKTGQDFGFNINRWYQWLWQQDEIITTDYGNFKGQIYQRIDPRFSQYFLGRQNTAKIRLDEIRWGGVRQDGIPPLRNPDMIDAQSAAYLEDEHIVFGIEINGDARAYPKRILAWHEMFTDTIGGVDIAGVYCTLCGTVIPYKTNIDGKRHLLGTSGFLYRSNKLMYDKNTQSLWSTMTGKPVLGPLVDQGIKLEYMSVVTTTWGEWKRRHPDTTVLSLDTGHRRNYGEGIAYQDYFADDELMFITPFNDDRLKNKQEVLALQFAAAPNEQLAIDTDFLSKNPIYNGRIGQQKFIVLTDKTGANRVYDPEDIIFSDYDGDSLVTDEKGGKWQLSESKLLAENGKTLQRLPYHRAFWFGWQAAYPDTKLIK